ncbi:hypothetical protein IJT17_02150 [bacterium]|nr:hypothetical protein [bacterium]
MSDSTIENSFKQRSAGQEARRHQHVAVTVIVLMVIILLGVTVWLIHMSSTVQKEIDQGTNLSLPITTSTVKAVTRKKEFDQPAVPVPARSRRPKDRKPREALPPADGQFQEVDANKLPPGTIIY